MQQQFQQSKEFFSQPLEFKHEIDIENTRFHRCGTGRPALSSPLSRVRDGREFVASTAAYSMEHLSTGAARSATRRLLKVSGRHQLRFACRGTPARRPPWRINQLRLLTQLYIPAVCRGRLLVRSF